MGVKDRITVYSKLLDNTFDKGSNWPGYNCHSGTELNLGLPHRSYVHVRGEMMPLPLLPEEPGHMPICFICSHQLTCLSGQRPFLTKRSLGL
jgi:hypothetical protein